MRKVKSMSDLIERQAAIDAVDIGNLHRGIVDALQSIISELPPAQPEIITCKDCVHSDTFSKAGDNDMPLKCLDIRYGGVMPGWYCEHAERKPMADVISRQAKRF